MSIIIDKINQINMSMLRKSRNKRSLMSSIIQQYHNNTIPIITEEILNSYHNDLSYIINTPGPSITDVYILLILNCNKRFYQLFKRKMKNNHTDISEFAFSQIIDVSLNNQSNIDDQSTLLQETKEELVNLKFSRSEIIEQIKDTITFRRLIKEIFEEIASTNELLLDEILDKFALHNSNKLKETNIDYFSFCSRIYTQENIFDYREVYLPYYEFHYEDFLVIFCSIINYFTGLIIRIELSDKESLKVLMKIYGSNSNVFNNLSELFGCNLQLKPYAILYEILIENKRHEAKRTMKDNKPINTLFQNKSKSSKEKKSTKNNGSKREHFYHIPLLYHNKNDKKRKSPIKKKTIQFTDLDINDHRHFPPYYQYDKSKEIKYRRYESNDNYHECDTDPEFSEKNIENNYCPACTKFRNIDKLRLIYKSLEKLFKFKTLYSNNILSLHVFQRNYHSYQKRLLTSSLFKDNIMILHDKNVMHLINIIRNYYGEYISFYFLWVAYFCKWMVFPSIIGIISVIVKYIYEPQLKQEINTFQNYKLDYNDITLMILGALITLWATIFLSRWKKQEKIFAYIWGMENYHETESTNENFVYHAQVPFVFGKKIQIDSFVNHCYKKIISVLIHGFMLVIRVWIMVKLFELKETDKPTISRDILIACISGVIIKIMSMIYDYIAWMTANWENYKKCSKQQNALAFKLILFEFFNNYSTLFYIAFYKPYQGKKCLFDNCHVELEIQLYTLLLINFSFNIWEVGWPWIKYKLRLLQITMRPVKHSNHHQLLCEGYSCLIYEYNERMISFGFVCLFTVAAPFTPVMVLFFTFIENFCDLYKVFNLYRIDTIEGSSGIDIYNFVLKMLYFIGMLTSVALVLFFNPHLMKTNEYQNSSLLKNNDFINKIVIFAIVENVILVLIKMVKFNKGPVWFEHLKEYKDIYEKKYYNKNRYKLPHINSMFNVYNKVDK